MGVSENNCTTTTIELPELPMLDAPTPRSAFVVLLPVVMLAGTVGFLVIGGGGTTSLLMGGLMAVSLIGMMVSGGGRQAKPAAVVGAERDRFLRRLDRARAAADTREAALRGAAHRRHPEPTVVHGGVATVGGPTSATTVRVGVGSVPAVVTYDVPEDDGDAEPEPFAVVARRRFLSARATTPSMPLTIDLEYERPVALRGCQATDLARAIVLQWARAVSPAEGRVVLLASDDAAGWDWLKWLPHHGAEGRVGAPLRTGDLLQARRWSIGEDLGAMSTPRSAVLLVTVGQPAPVREALRGRPDVHHGRYLLDVDGSGGSQPVDDGRGDVVVLWCERGVLGRWVAGRCTPWGAADMVGPAAATATARRIALRQLAPTVGAAQITKSPTDLAGLLGLDHPADLRPGTRCRDASVIDRLRIPIGVDDAGAAVQLDLKEAASGGAGPHGLLIGATGSGKSELLRTIVLALAATHSTSSLNLVLIDFKGGAGFLALQPLPHVAAVITNLADQAVLVERMRDALAGELHRRQEILRRVGNLSSVVDYDRARRRSPELEALPALVVICDEFTELLVQHPDLADLFVMLGRLGRSLGVHLLMASQRMDEGRMRGLDAHLSYRIALKTFSAADSRAVLDVDTAYRLPSTPGVGYVKAVGAEPTRFTAAYVSGPVSPVAQTAAVVAAPIDHAVRLFTAVGPRAPEVPPAETRPNTGGTSDQPSLADLWVERLRDSGPPAHPLWLPPLSVAPLLAELSDAVGTSGPGRAIRVPVGIVDRPFDQRRDVWWADFGGSTGHALVVGGVRSGKSTLLTTLVLSLARQLSPREMHCYVVDLGGGTMSMLASVPQVGGVVRRDEPQRLRRLIAQLLAELASRERADSRPPDPSREPHPDVFLVIDGWSGFRASFDEWETGVATLVSRGLAHGMHVVLATSRWADVRPAMKDLMGLRIELRLGDPSESEVDRRLAARVPAQSPGRGLTPDGFHFLAGVPSSPDDPTRTAQLIDDLRAASLGAEAPPIRVLPERVSIGDLPAVPPTGFDSVPIGLGETDLSTVVVDFSTDPHLVVWGDAGCGKTSFVRTLAATIAVRRGPNEARFLVVDHRRTSLGRVPPDHVAGHATAASTTAGLVAEAVSLLTGRLPGDDISADQLAGREWWTGPELFVLVDDYELVAAGSTNPVLPLLDLLPYARDIGLHLVVCRRAAGGGRAQYDPVLQQLRELGSPGLVLSGPPDEGVLHGAQRAAPQPPGRGFWVTRTGSELVQLAMTDD